MSAGQTAQTSFAPSSEPIANPERGFYRYSATYSGNYNHLDPQELVRYRASDGVTLLFRYFFLDDFTDRPISNEYLQNVESDFDILREAGLKSIVRFAYIDEVRDNFAPPYGDAPKERILQHINQLAPILQDNSDVIAVIQAGFIGIWGEWYYTDYFANPDNPSDISPEQYTDREEVLLALLDAVEEERSVQLRYVPMKAKLLGLPDEVDGALSADEAHQPTAKARVGFHNDCFLASPTDHGTYRWDRTEEDKEYLARDSRFLPIGGETCSPNPPRSSCETALEELEQFHWSYLNADYHPDVLSAWHQSGCMGEIQKRLGYRFTLQEAEVTRTAPAGTALDLTVRLANTGWAAPFNPRDVRVLLRTEDGDVKHTAALSSDPRFWMPGQDVALEASIELPSDLPEGTYDVLLHLPDPNPRLASRPEYAIRFANDGVWEPETGYNDLGLRVNIEDRTLPVEITRFEIRQDRETIALQWTTGSETNNAGFEVQRRTDKSKSQEWKALTFVEGRGTASEGQNYRYVDSNVPNEANAVSYRLKQMDNDEAFHYSETVEVQLDTAERDVLWGNFPNPARGHTTIRYELAKSQHVVLKIFDALGNEAATLVDEVQEQGLKEISFDGGELASGVYMCQLKTSRKTETKTMVLVK